MILFGKKAEWLVYEAGMPEKSGQRRDSLDCIMEQQKQQQKQQQNIKVELRQSFPLQPLLSPDTIISLCLIISKLERKAYIRLKQANKTMFDFMETNKKLIQFNLLQDEIVKIEETVNKDTFDIGFANLWIRKDFTTVTEKGTGNKVDILLSTDEVVELLKGSKPKNIYLNSTKWEILDTLRNLKFAHGSIVTYTGPVDVCRLKALTYILKPDELIITEEGNSNNSEQLNSEPEMQTFPLQKLVNSHKTLCQIISKLDRKSYFRLQSTNKTMLNFIKTNKNSIEPNPLRGENLVISDEGFDMGFAIFKKEEGLFKILERGTGKFLNCGVPFRDIFEFLGGSKPKKVIYKSKNWNDLELLRDLALAPGSLLSCGKIKENEFFELVNILKPAELEVVKSVNDGEKTVNIFQLFKEVDFKYLKSIRLTNFDQIPMGPETFYERLLAILQGRFRPRDDWVEQDPMELGNLLEWIGSCELEGWFAEFPVYELKKCIQNWTNGLNQIEFFYMRTLKPKVHTPVMWMIMGDVRNTACRVSNLPTFMRDAFEADTAGTIKNPDYQVDLRVIKRPTHIAYLYVTLVGTLGFRSFNEEQCKM